MFHITFAYISTNSNKIYTPLQQFMIYVKKGKGKGKVHRCTGTEALYRLYGP